MGQNTIKDMITIKSEHEELVKKLFKITNTSGEGIEVIKKLGNEFLPGQMAAVCWNCPPSINQFYRRLITLFEGGYEIEQPAPAVDELQKAIKEVNNYGTTTNDANGPANSDGDKKQKLKRSNTNTANTGS
jgi:hypothetical protein